MSTNEKNAKNRPKGIMWVSRNTLLEFWDPLYISGTVKPTNFKFGTIWHRDGWQ